MYVLSIIEDLLQPSLAPTGSERFRLPHLFVKAPRKKARERLLSRKAQVAVRADLFRKLSNFADNCVFFTLEFRAWFETLSLVLQRKPPVVLAAFSHQEETPLNLVTVPLKLGLTW